MKKDHEDPLLYCAKGVIMVYFEVHQRCCGFEDAKGSSEGVGLRIHFARLEEGACTTTSSCHCVHFVTSFGAVGSATEFGARRGCVHLDNEGSKAWGLASGGEWAHEPIA